MRSYWQHIYVISHNSLMIFVKLSLLSSSMCEQRELIHPTHMITITNSRNWTSNYTRTTLGDQKNRWQLGAKSRTVAFRPLLSRFCGAAHSREAPLNRTKLHSLSFVCSTWLWMSKERLYWNIYELPIFVSTLCAFGTSSQYRQDLYANNHIYPQLQLEMLSTSPIFFLQSNYAF